MAGFVANCKTGTWGQRLEFGKSECTQHGTSIVQQYSQVFS